MIDKITLEKINKVISAELPDIHIVPGLFRIITKNIIRGLCDAIKKFSEKDEECVKRYLRDVQTETIAGNDENIVDDQLKIVKNSSL